MFVLPPSITTVDSSRARRSRASASSRVGRGQHLGDEHGVAGGEDVALGDGYVDPDAGPAPRRRRATTPGVGANPRSGSSALSRACSAWPRGGGGSPSRWPP